MKNMIKYYIIILLGVSFSNCKKDKIEIEDIKFELKAIGSSERIDEGKWGNFNLVLELEKSTFSKDESCITQLSFVNCGKKEIILDGIFPYRSSASEPFIYVSDGLNNYKIDTLLKDLHNENSIIIKVNNSVKLMKFNFTDVIAKKIIKNDDGFSVSQVEVRLVDELKPGKYYMWATFFPTPQVYSSITDTLIFEIK